MVKKMFLQVPEFFRQLFISRELCGFVRRIGEVSGANQAVDFLACFIRMVFKLRKPVGEVSD